MPLKYFKHFPPLYSTSHIFLMDRIRSFVWVDVVGRDGIVVVVAIVGGTIGGVAIVVVIV